MDLEISFDQIIAMLLDESRALQPATLFRLSNLDPDELALLRKSWTEIPLERRRSLAAEMNLAAEEDLLLAFEPVAQVGLDDSDPDVRRNCVEILWQDDTPALQERFTEMMEGDEDYQVRASAASALAHFVWLGELEEISAERLNALVDRLIQVAGGDDHPLVRRRALETLGFSIRPEVPNLIEDAYGAEDEEWVASSLLAMGRSANQRWTRDVLDMLEHESALVRQEAARAAGELEISEATAALLDMLQEDEEEVRQAAIWSLSQIGGDEISEVFYDLIDQAEDEEEFELLEAALDNLAFTENVLTFSMFDFEEIDPEERTGPNGSLGDDTD